MRVVELWRYPVKSLQGERLDASAVGRLGLEGDRSHAIVEAATGRVLTAMQDLPLLHAAARLLRDGSVEVVLPDGWPARGDEELSTWLGRPVRLERARPGPPAASVRWDGPPGAFHDLESVRVSLVGTGTISALGDWDLRRFRANIVLDGEVEDGLVGRRVRIGGATVDVLEPVVRCAVVTRPQPGIARDLDVLRTILRERGGNLAVGAVVAEPGPVRVGDVVEILEVVR